MRRWLVVVVVSLCLAACGGSSGGPQGGGQTVQTTPQAGAASGPLPQLRVQRVFPNLSFANLTNLIQAPDGRFFAVEQQGRILAFDNRHDAQASVVLDIRDKVDDSSNEMGLLGLALAPDFATSGAYYVDYTAANPRRTIISRFIGNNETVLLEIGQPFVNHNGGQIAFGPDGFLYIGMGDGGSGNDPMGNGQNRNALLGKVLRIDVSGSSGGLAYRIPADNPFAGQSGARGEVWAYGLRNPWRFSFDSATGQMWIGDVGQNAWEEVDIGLKGANYGWNIMEATHCRPGGSSSCNGDGLTLPIVEYATAQPNCSVTGGFVYRGKAIPSLVGAYVYGDYCSGRIWALRWDGSKVTEQGLLIDSELSLASFAVDSQGEIYALDHVGSGGIYRLVP